MNLFDFQDEHVVISAEALALEPFAKVWKSNKNKNKASKELAYIYFMASKSNELTFWQIDDEEERSKQVIEFIFGEKSGYKPTANVLAALEFYRKHIIPYSAGLLEDALIGAQKARDYITAVDWNKVDKNNKFVYDPNKVRDLFLKLPEFDDVIKTLRRKVREEESESGDKKRGQHTIGMYETGDDDI